MHGDTGERFTKLIVRSVEILFKSDVFHNARQIDATAFLLSYYGIHAHNTHFLFTSW